MNCAVTINGLDVGIGGRTPVRQLSLSVQPGERVALVGPSGSGKSLTAAAVVGALPSAARTAGSIRVAGREVLGVPAARRPVTARVGLVAQNSALALHPLVTVGRQLTAALRAAGMPRPAAAAVERLADLGLTEPERVAAGVPGQLSGGQRQRVAVAMALAADVAVLVADEPTSALDVVAQARLLDLLRARCAPPHGPGLLFITHDLAVAARLGDRIAVLDTGRVVQDAPVAEILTRADHPRTRAMLAAARATHEW